MHFNNPTVTKKAYCQPQLTVYGNIRELTQARNNFAQVADGGTFGSGGIKTGPA